MVFVDICTRQNLICRMKGHRTNDDRRQCNDVHLIDCRFGRLGNFSQIHWSIHKPNASFSRIDFRLDGINRFVCDFLWFHISYFRNIEEWDEMTWLGSIFMNELYGKSEWLDSHAKTYEMNQLIIRENMIHSECYDDKSRCMALFSILSVSQKMYPLLHIVIQIRARFEAVVRFSHFCVSVRIFREAYIWWFFSIKMRICVEVTLLSPMYSSTGKKKWKVKTLIHHKHTHTHTQSLFVFKICCATKRHERVWKFLVIQLDRKERNRTE